MATKGNPVLFTRVSRDLDAAIEARIELAIAKSTRGPRDRADFARRAAYQYLRKLERSATSRKRRKNAFSACAVREAWAVDECASTVYTEGYPAEDRATQACDPSAVGAVSESGNADSQLP